MYYYGLGQFQANLHLQPETIKSYEIVVEQGFGEHFHLTNSLFRNQLNDLIIQGLNSSGLLVFGNCGRAHINGFETEIDGRFPGGLQGRASYSYTDNQDSQARRHLTNSPHQLAKLNVIVPMLRQKLFARLEGQLNGRATTLQGRTTSSFQVFNLTLLGHAMGNHLELSASAYNLLDKKYFDPAPVGLTQDQIQQDGSNFRAKITVRF